MVLLTPRRQRTSPRDAATKQKTLSSETYKKWKKMQKQKKEGKQTNNTEPIPKKSERCSVHDGLPDGRRHRRLDQVLRSLGEVAFERVAPVVNEVLHLGRAEGKGREAEAD